MIENDGWTDLGANASRWGGEDCKPTCKANKQTNASRIDHVVASPEALKYITGFDSFFNPAIPHMHDWT